MAAPTVQNTYSAASGTVTIAQPAAGDIIVAFCFHAGLSPPTQPTGYTNAGSATTSGRSCRLAYKVATGSSETTVVFSGTLTTPVTIVYVVRGASAGTVDGTSSCQTTAGPTAHATPSITPSGGFDVLAVGFAAALSGGVWSGETIGGTAATERKDQQNSTSTTGCGYDRAILAPAASGITGTANVSSGASGVAGIILIAGDAVRTPVSGTDTGTGADSASIQAQGSDADSGAGAESASLGATGAGSDTGAAAEASSLAVQITASDTGTGADSASVSTGGVPVAGSDTGQGTETQTVTAQITATDTGTGAESVSDRKIVLQDTGQGTEAQSLTTTFQVTATDSGLGTETASVLTPSQATGADAGIGTDSISARVISDADTGQGTETQTLATPQLVVASDSGTGSETAAVTKQVVVTDSGVGSDDARADWFFPAPDEDSFVLSPMPESALAFGPVIEPVLALASAPESTLTLAPISEVLLGWGERNVLEAFQVGNDNGHGVEAQSLTQTPAFFQPESGTGADSGTVTARVSDADVGQGSEIFNLAGAGQNFSPDFGVAAEASAVTAQILVADQGGSVVEFGSIGDTDADVSAGDTGTSAESATPRVFVSASDAGTGTDTGSKTGLVVPAFVAERAKGSGVFTSGSGTKTITIPVSGVAIGDALFVCAGLITPPITAPTVTDDAGNVYVRYGRSGGSVETFIWVAPITAVPTTLTITGTNDTGANVTIAYKVEEFSGFTSPSPFDVGDYVDVAANQTIIGFFTLTPHYPNELYLACLVTTAAESAPTVTAGFTFCGTTRNASPDIIVFYKIMPNDLSASGSATVTLASTRALGLNAVYKSG